jgi:hypothetical protein
MKFLRSQTTSGAGLKFFEWVFERKKKWKRKKKTKLEYFSKTFKYISENARWHRMWHAMLPHIFKMQCNTFCSDAVHLIKNVWIKHAVQAVGSELRDLHFLKLRAIEKSSRWELKQKMK